MVAAAVDVAVAAYVGSDVDASCNYWISQQILRLKCLSHRWRDISYIMFMLYVKGGAPKLLSRQGIAVVGTDPTITTKVDRNESSATLALF